MKAPRGESGFVYFARCEVPACTKCGQQPERPIKVGHTFDVDRRINDLQTGNPFELRLVYQLATEQPDRAERSLHSVHLSSAHIRGEWFQEDAARRLADNLQCGAFLTPDDEEDLQALVQVRAARMRAARTK